MVSKNKLLKCSVANFTKFGSKRFTLDELAQAMGISKKTIYKYFKGKEELVVESVLHLTEGFRKEIAETIKTQTDPIISVILIYKKGFEHLKHFKPAFIFGLKKYYPKANSIFDEFRDYVVNTIIYSLLEDAQQKGIVMQEVNLDLFCNLYFRRFEEIALKNDSLFHQYSQKELLNHLIIYSLKGITRKEYTNRFFE